MVRISVSRKDLKKISLGKAAKIKVKAEPKKKVNNSLFLETLNNIIKTRYFGKRSAK